MITVGFAAVWLVDSILGKLKSEIFQKTKGQHVWYYMIFDYMWWYLMYMYAYLMICNVYLCISDVYVCICMHIWCICVYISWYLMIQQIPTIGRLPAGFFFFWKSDPLEIWMTYFVICWPFWVDFDQNVTKLGPYAGRHAIDQIT